MKKLLAIVCLGLVAITFGPLRAEEATSVTPSKPAVDNAAAVDGVVLYKHPEDFDSAQQLAIQNRLDRIDGIKAAMNCIQKATTMDDIHACQQKGLEETAKIRLAYCDTGMSWITDGQIRYPPLRNVRKSTQKPANDTNAASDTTDAATANSVYPRLTECQMAEQSFENLKAKQNGQVNENQPQGAAQKN